MDEVFRLADERMALMPGVAAYKWQRKAPVTDPERERAVTTHAVEVARTMGLAPEGIQALFDVQVRAARESQIRLHEAWRTRGYDFPGPIPDLARDVRPTLDRFTVDFLRALYRAAPDLERTNFATVATAPIDRLRAPGWTEDDKRELLAALARVHRLPFGAGSPTRLERIKAAGVLRMGTTGDYAPFSIEQDGVLSGADIDLAESLAKRLGVTPLFVRTTWGSMLDDLQADQFDLALGGVSVTPARAAVAVFSVPYSSGGKTILSRCEDAKRFGTLAAVDRRGVRVIVNPGGTNEQYVRANVHRATVTVFPDNRAIFDELRARRADVMITDDVEVELQTHRHPELCRAMSATLTHSDKAVLLPKGDTSLVDEVNAWLTSAIKEREPARLLEQHLRN
ncbi:MAG TPA: transporter substrate-binding domain-containing protein [Steroidobacteraceae bacterium]|nr:transporter substrate-binding domain-containing protein [Steroidobacteraceae bacterium]